MTTHQLPKRQSWQIVGAIAAKDIAEGWRNRALLGIIGAVFLTLLTAQALPMLLGLTGQQNVVVVAPRQSALTASLAESDALRVSRRTTPEAALAELAQAAGGIIGIFLPPEAEARLLAGEAVTLEAFTPRATTPGQLAEARETLLAAVRAATGAEASLSVTTLYPGVDAGGRPVMAITSLLLVALVPGLLIVPLLVLEEKETRTLDALLVSPATSGEIVLGKALAGMVFGLVAAAIGLFVFRNLIVHWGLAVAAMLLVVLLGVAIGLLLGGMFRDQGSLNLWLGLVLLALVVPVGLRVMPRLAYLGEAGWYRAIPSVALARLLGAAMTNPLPLREVALGAILAVLFIAALLVLVGWSLRREQI